MNINITGFLGVVFSAHNDSYNLLFYLFFRQYFYQKLQCMDLQ